MPAAEHGAPTAREGDQPGAAPAGPTPGGGQVPQQRILVVEDDPDLCVLSTC